MGGRIRAAREAMDMTQTDLAKAMGFDSPTAISLIEKGERGINAVLLTRMGEVLQRSAGYFLGEPEKVVDVKVALRADKNLSDDDKKAIERFIDMAKKKPDAKS